MDGPVLATYPKTILTEDERPESRSGFAPTFPPGRAVVSVRRSMPASLLWRGSELPSGTSFRLSVVGPRQGTGHPKEVSDEGEFFEKRDIPALVKEIADWNAFIAAGVGAIDELVGDKAAAPIKGFPDFEHLEAQGQDQIDGLLRCIKERQRVGEQVKEKTMDQDWDDIDDDWDDDDEDDWEDLEDDWEDET